LPRREDAGDHHGRGGTTVPRAAREYSGRHHASGGSAQNTAFENYEIFLITELKPQIDRDYRTLPGPAHTA